MRSLKSVRSWALAVAIVLTAIGTASAGPVVFWAQDSIEPGNVVLLYGGGLGKAREAVVWRVADGDAMPDGPGREPSAPATAQARPVIQPAEPSVKFLMPADVQPGLFAAQVKVGGDTTKAVVLNRPTPWFLQPVRLQPGLDENQAPAGALVQIVGKDFLLPGNRGTPRVALRRQDGPWQTVKVTRGERFSLLAQLPADLAAGRYELWVHNGFGGAAGWGGPLAIEIKPADRWPEKVFDVKKDFGARGDDVTDDTPAIENALAAADKNGGGVVSFPWGTYRLTRWVCIPPHTVLRGESRDASILKWPVDEPQTLADFTPGAIYGAAPYAVEDLTLIARKVDTLFTDVSAGKGVPKELQTRTTPGKARDVFFRRVNLQHWLLAAHPDRNASLWPKKYNGDGANTLLVSGVTNFELSDCQSQGGQLHIRNLRNARETGNLFGNEMGYCWAEMGGGAQYLVSEGNEIRASSSWGYGNTGMKYVYSAHNKSYNFVRGEREAMTLDISALPTIGPADRNVAWFGLPQAVDGLRLTLAGIKAADNRFVDMVVMILDGPGAGQYRVITANTPTVFTVDRPWDVPPDTTSTIGVWALMRHMIVYQSEGYDCSAFAQLYGSFYDYVVDSCRVERNQGIWGQSGWFVQFRYNDVWYANSYHPGIGPRGNNPEKNSPFSFVGLTDGNLRVTKFGSEQYGRKLVFVNEVVPHPVPGALGAIVKGNVLKYNQRVAFPPSADPKPHATGPVRMLDIVVDDNHIEHSPVGVQIGPQTRRVVVADNHFKDVAEPYLLANPENVKVIEAKRP